MTQPPNAPFGPPNNGWQQQPNNYGPGPTQPPYGAPGQPPAPYGAPGQPQAPYGGPGQAPYGGPGYQPGYGGGGPRRTWVFVVLGAVVLLVLIIGIAVALSTRSASTNTSGPTEPSTAPPPPSTSAESSVRPSPPPTSTAPSTAAPRLAEAKTLATRFVGYLNANDQTHATALGCEESRKLLTGQLIVMIDPPTKLAVTGPGVSVPSYYPRISVPFSGTTNGSVPLTGTVDIMDIPSRPLCVRLTSLQH